MMQHEEKKEGFNRALLIKHLLGETTDEEMQVIAGWLKSDRDREQFSEFSRRIWKKLSGDLHLKSYDEGRMLDSIHHRIRLQEALDQKRFSTGRVVSILVRAAAILFIPLLAYSLVNYRNNLLNRRNTISYNEIYAPPGTRTMFLLPDGSTGYLNGGSYLKCPTQFTGKNRMVSLSGEAYFDIKEHPRKPFIVSSENIEAWVYGTTFNFRAYPDELNTRVALESGQLQIMVKRSGKLEKMGVMKPDQVCFFNSSSGSCWIENRNIVPEVSWKDGKLVFRDDPFTEVVRKINRWYNVNISIRDKNLESYKYHATFKDETLDEVLKLLQLTAPITYKETGRKILADGTFGKRNIEIYRK